MGWVWLRSIYCCHLLFGFSSHRWSPRTVRSKQGRIFWNSMDWALWTPSYASHRGPPHLIHHPSWPSGSCLCSRTRQVSKAVAFLSKAIAVSVDAGLHRSAHSHDLFSPIEEEIRKRTFWSVCIWDKQLSAYFGRPPMIPLQDCDIGEPAIIDDEFTTRERILTQPSGGRKSHERFCFDHPHHDRGWICPGNASSSSQLRTPSIISLAGSRSTLQTQTIERAAQGRSATRRDSPLDTRVSESHWLYHFKCSSHVRVS